MAALSFGNRCGHHPSAPILQLAKPPHCGAGGHPRILTLSYERLGGYYDDPDIFPSLSLTHPSSRQRRSERREATVRLLRAATKFLDLVTLTVGLPDPEGFQNVSVAFLAKQAGLELRRTERVLRDLGRAGLVTVVERRRITAEGDFRSEPALKRISPLLFSALGLGVALELERAKARKRRRLESQQRDSVQQLSPEELERRKHIRAAVKKFANSLVPGLSAPRDTRPGDLEEEQRRRWSLEALRIRQEHPDWPADQVRAAADRALLS